MSRHSLTLAATETAVPLNYSRERDDAGSQSAITTASCSANDRSWPGALLKRTAGSSESKSMRLKPGCSVTFKLSSLLSPAIAVPIASAPLIRINGAEAIGTAIAGERNELNLKVTLQPGFNRIDLDSLEPAVRLSNAPGQLRSFALHEAVVMAD